MNPKWGREYENTRKEEPVEKKKILIAGGGPAGMEAALTAAQRGHEVILCEKNDHLAGNLDYSKIEFKKDIVEFLKSMVIRVQREKNIDLRLDTEVNEELIKQEKPDVVMVACGSEPIIPPIPGHEKPMVQHITDL